MIGVENVQCGKCGTISDLNLHKKCPECGEYLFQYRSNKLPEGAIVTNVNPEIPPSNQVIDAPTGEEPSNIVADQRESDDNDTLGVGAIPSISKKKFNPSMGVAISGFIVALTTICAILAVFRNRGLFQFIIGVDALIAFFVIVPAILLWLIGSVPLVKNKNSSLAKESRNTTLLSLATFVICVIHFSIFPYSGSSPFDGASQVKTPANSATDRQKAQDYWSKPMSCMATSLLTIKHPETIMKISGYNGQLDPVTASTLYKKCNDLADEAFYDAGENAPDGWDDVRSDLQIAAMQLQKACKALRKSLDTGAPSDVVEARDHLGDVDTYIESAIQKGRDHYVQMGGKADQLRDYGIPKLLSE